MIYGGWRLSELEDALTELKNTLEGGVLVVGEDELYLAQVWWIQGRCLNLSMKDE